jgi:hypothetical protein
MNVWSKLDFFSGVFFVSALQPAFERAEGLDSP